MTLAYLLIFAAGGAMGIVLSFFIRHEQEIVGTLHVDVSRGPADIYLELTDDPESLLTNKKTVTLNVCTRE